VNQFLIIEESFDIAMFGKTECKADGACRVLPEPMNNIFLHIRFHSGAYKESLHFFQFLSWLSIDFADVDLRPQVRPIDTILDRAASVGITEQVSFPG
jgi:hypothetical protein